MKCLFRESFLNIHIPCLTVHLYMVIMSKIAVCAGSLRSTYTYYIIPLCCICMLFISLERTTGGMAGGRTGGD